MVQPWLGSRRPVRRFEHLGMTDHGKHIEIKPAAGTWVIRAAGAVLGESSAAPELIEGGHDAVIYFDLAAKSGTFPTAAWSCETPLDGVAQLAGYLAFYSDKIRSQSNDFDR